MPTEEFAHESLTEGLAVMTANVLSASDVSTGLRHAVATVAAIVSGEPMVAAVVKQDEVLTAATSSTVLGDLFQAVEMEESSTPCQDVMDTETPRHVRDLAVERRWGGFPKLAARHGIVSLYCHPLRTDAGMVGALGVYSPRRDAFGPGDRSTVSVSAKHMGALLGMVVRDGDSTRLAAQLRAALDARSTVDQAVGVIMARRRCDREAAYGVLRALAQRRAIPPAELARQMVEDVSGTRPQPGPFYAHGTPPG